jgi:signal transduction histidine kinase
MRTRVGSSVPRRWPSVATAVLLVAGACGLGLWAVWPWLDEDPTGPLLFAAVGVTFVVTGVLFRLEPAQRPNGALFIAIGFVWLANDLGSRPVGLLPATAWLARPVDELLLIVILMRYPAVRIGDRLTRRVVVAAWVAVLVPYVASGLLWDPYAQGWSRMFWWPTVVGVNDVAHRLWYAYAVAAFVVATTVVALVVRRYAGSRGLARRELRPVLVSTGAVAVVYVALQAVALVTGGDDPGRSLNLLSSLVVLTIPVAFAAAALRRRLDRSAVADLVLAIPQPPTVPAVRDALRVAMADPALDVYVWLPDQSAFTDGTGIVTGDPRADGRMRREVTDVRGDRLAIVLTDSDLNRRPDVVDAAVRAAALSLENARMHAELLAQLQELEQSRTRIVEAGLDQRRRVERDLHDGAQQRLLALAATIGRARNAAADPATRALLEQARDELRQALKELRDLARGIHPAVLEQVGLAAAIETVAEAAPLPVRVLVETDRLDPAVASTAYFVVCEALTNTVKHAAATRAEVTVRHHGGELRVTVTDDGGGGAATPAGGGLAGLTDRVAALGGRLRLDSPVGAGTRLTVELPCAS